MSSTTTRADAPIAVLGAGVAGAAAAARLVEAGLPVQVFDKGRGPGGRCSTRRSETASEPGFDHGAQYFTARGPRLRARCADWSASGSVQSWKGPFLRRNADGWQEEQPSTTRWVGVPGMNQLPRLLLASAPTRFEARVVTLLPGGRLELASGEILGPFRLILLTLPPSQAAALVEDSPALATAAAGVAMVPCITWMVRLAGVDPVKASAFRDATDEVGWIAREASKPGRDGSSGWVVQMSPAASTRWLESDEATWRARMEPALAEALGRAPVATHSAFHRWRFAQRDDAPESHPSNAASPEVLDLDRGWGLGGDWLRGGRIEAAFDSGEALAERAIAALG